MGWDVWPEYGCVQFGFGQGFYFSNTLTLPGVVLSPPVFRIFISGPVSLAEYSVVECEAVSLRVQRDRGTSVQLERTVNKCSRVPEERGSAPDT